MIAIFSLLVTLSLSLLATRIAAIALQLTGLSPEIAEFQARSAFTGVGLSTLETEKVVNHPVRRRIIMSLMLAGNLGIAAVVATSMLSFLNQDESQNWVQRMAFFVIGLAILWVISISKLINRWMTLGIEWALRKWTKLDVMDYVSLLRLSDGYVVVQLVVNESDWVSGKTLAEADLASEGVLVLGILRENGSYVGSPNGKFQIQGGDELSVYGRIERIEEFNLRGKGSKGDVAHKQAISEQSKLIEQKVQEVTDSDENSSGN